MAYRIEYSPGTQVHMRALTAAQQTIVKASVLVQLAHQPSVEARNRKPMKANPLATWELRIQNLRAYYDVEEEPEPVVRIRAVGIKRRNRVFIANEETQL